ncbi:MAG: hydrogenase maturation nickel metallochaperone HypA [Polyangiaceae bacterium]
MHEYSVVEALIQRVAQEVAARGAQSVNAVKVSIGELSGVDRALLQEAFESLRVGTVCAGAKLEVTHADGDEIALEGIEMKVDDG